MDTARTGRQPAPRSCCSASMSGTTQRRRRPVSATVAGTGSPATSTAASYAFPPDRGARARAGWPRTAATATADPRRAATTSSSARLRPVVFSSATRSRTGGSSTAPSPRGRDWASTGHAAAVVGDDLYEILPQTRGGYGRLQDFGIRFGYERVYCTSNRTSRPIVCSTTRPGRCCCSTTSRCHGLAGVRSSLPRCPQRSSGCKNARPARTQSRTRRRSASASRNSSWNENGGPSLADFVFRSSSPAAPPPCGPAEAARPKLGAPRP
jgi:hypothetical protein